MSCPLCHSFKDYRFFEDQKRHYQKCIECSLVFVPSHFHLSQEKEKKIYDLHENNLDDLGYRKYLSRICDPMALRLSLGQKGLDFGSGPGPLLAKMFREKGYEMNIFDLYYHYKPSVLAFHYDFVTMTEVIEHLKRPFEILVKLKSLLSEGGAIGIMTKLAKEESAFASWHYKNDPTHICFFSKKTFEWVSQKLGMSIEFIGEDIIFLEKN